MHGCGVGAAVGAAVGVAVGAAVMSVHRVRVRRLLPVAVLAVARPAVLAILVADAALRLVTAVRAVGARVWCRCCRGRRRRHRRGCSRRCRQDESSTPFVLFIVREAANRDSQGNPGRVQGRLMEEPQVGNAGQFDGLQLGER